MNYPDHVRDILRCPRCGSALNGLNCVNCGATYIMLKDNMASFMPENSPELEELYKIKKRMSVMINNQFSHEMIKFTASELYGRKGIFLDVGCGTGYYSSEIMKRLGSGVKFVGIDVDTNFDPEVDSGNYFFIQADYLKNPFKPGSFDAIMNFDVIEHFEDDGAFIDTTVKLLKKGGCFIIGTPNGDRLPVKLHEIIHGRRKFPFSYGKDIILGEILHVREYTRKDIEKLMESFLDRVEYRIVPMLLGSRIGNNMIGIKYPKGFLGNYCYYWWIIGRKK